MSDRRRRLRFVIPEASSGWLRLMQDVSVESVDAGTVVIDAELPLSRGEELVLELPREHGTRSLVQVSVSSITPYGVGDARRHRAVLAIDRSQQAPDLAVAVPGSPLAVTRTPLPALGVLIRRVPVRVRDVSATGCSLESADLLPEDSVALLELDLGGERHTETLRVCRSTRRTGSGWPWRSGATFLPLNAPAASSVRNIVARFEIIDEIGGMPDNVTRMYQRLPIAYAPKTDQDPDEDQTAYAGAGFTRPEGPST